MNLNTSVNVLFFTDQERNPVSVSLKKISDDIFEAEFTPLFEGTHKIAVTIDERHIRGSPFTVTILDLSAVRIIGLKNDAVGVEQRFNGWFENFSTCFIFFLNLNINARSNKYCVQTIEYNKFDRLINDI